MVHDALRWKPKTLMDCGKKSSDIRRALNWHANSLQARTPCLRGRQTCFERSLARKHIAIGFAAAGLCSTGTQRLQLAQSARALTSALLALALEATKPRGEVSRRELAAGNCACKQQAACGWLVSCVMPNPATHHSHHHHHTCRGLQQQQTRPDACYSLLRMAS